MAHRFFSKNLGRFKQNLVDLLTTLKDDSSSSGSHLHRPPRTRVVVPAHLSWKELWIPLWEHDVESEFNSDSYKAEKDFRFIILTTRPSDWTI